MFIESSPHPVLIAGIEETVAMVRDGVGCRLVVVPTLGRDDGGLERFWMSAGQAHVAGVGVDWRSVFAGWGGRRVELPTYAFQRQRFWLPGSAGRGMWAVWGWAGSSMRCWVRWWSSPIRVGWC